MSKKARGPNFSINEKDILVHLVTKHKDKVENKKTDAVTTAVKNEGWRKLTEEFNSLSSFSVRNTDQLKTCWDNIKRNTRKDKATIKKQILLTGGGRPDLPPPGPFQGQVEILLGPTLDGMENKYDSDYQFTEQEILNKKWDSIESENDDAGPSCAEDESAKEPDDKENTESSNEKKVWNGWSSAALKTKVSDTLSVKRKSSDASASWIRRRRPKTSLHDKLLESKLELVQIMKKNAENEAEIKQKILENQLIQEQLKTDILKLQLHKMENAVT